MSNILLGNQIQVGKRLREFRSAKGMKAIEFSKICGISQGSLSGLENGKSYPSAETLINLIVYTDINIEWLLTNEGPMMRKSQLGAKPATKRKFKILDEAEEWLEEKVRKNPDRKAWFELSLLDTFSEFKEWRRKKDQEENSEDGSPTRKVA